MEHIEPLGWNDPPLTDAVEEAECPSCGKPLTEKELDDLNEYGEETCAECRGEVEEDDDVQ